MTPQQNLTLIALMSEADAALYRAKKRRAQPGFNLAIAG